MQVSNSFKKRVESELESIKTKRNALQKKVETLDSTIADMEIVLGKIEEPTHTEAGVEEQNKEEQNG